MYLEIAIGLAALLVFWWFVNKWPELAPLAFIAVMVAVAAWVIASIFLAHVHG